MRGARVAPTVGNFPNYSPLPPKPAWEPLHDPGHGFVDPAFHERLIVDGAIDAPLRPGAPQEAARARVYEIDHDRARVVHVGFAVITDDVRLIDAVGIDLLRAACVVVPPEIGPGRSGLSESSITRAPVGLSLRPVA